MVRTVHTNHFYEISPQISDPKIEFSTKTHFLKVPCPKFREKHDLAEKKTAGWFHSKTKVVSTCPTIPDPIRTKLYLKIVGFIAILLKTGDFELKSLKNLKLLRKLSWEHHGSWGGRRGKRVRCMCKRDMKGRDRWAGRAGRPAPHSSSTVHGPLEKWLLFCCFVTFYK